MRIFSFAKETVSDALRTVTSAERIRDVFGVSLYRNSTYLMAGSLLNGVVGILFWREAWRLFGKDSVGLAAPAISAAMLLMLFSSLGLHLGIVKFLPNSGSRGRNLLNTCFTVGALSSTAFAVVFLLGLSIWGEDLVFLRKDVLTFVGFVAFTAGYAMQIFSIHALASERRSEFAFAGNVVFNIFRFVPLYLLGLGCVASMTTESRAFVVFASWGVGVSMAAVVGIGVFLPLLRRGYRPVPSVDGEVVREVVRYSFVNYVAELLLSAPGLLLPLMVLGLLGKGPSADFAISWQISVWLLMVPVAVSTALFAEGSYDEGNLKRDVRKSLKFCVILLIPAVLLVYLLGDKALLFISGEERSHDATRLLWIFALSILPVSINYVYFGVRRVQMRMKVVVALSACAALGTLALGYFFLDWMGITGAGVAWLASQTVVAVVAMVGLVRVATRPERSAA